MPIALAGGTDATIVSIVGLVLLPHFTTKEACTLRLVCKDFVKATAEVKWHDLETVVKGDLRSWRACFPKATAANVSGRKDLTDSDFEHLAGLRTLDMRCCTMSATSDTGIGHLAGIHTLDMRDCLPNPNTISKACLAKLKSMGLQLLLCTPPTYLCVAPGCTKWAQRHALGADGNSFCSEEHRGGHQ